MLQVVKSPARIFAAWVGEAIQASTTLCAESYPFARFSPHISSLFTVYQSLPFGLV